jgi:hypothetical protein
MPSAFVSGQPIAEPTHLLHRYFGIVKNVFANDDQFRRSIFHWSLRRGHLTPLRFSGGANTPPGASASWAGRHADRYSSLLR